MKHLRVIFILCLSALLSAGAFGQMAGLAKVAKKAAEAALESPQVSAKPSSDVESEVSREVASETTESKPKETSPSPTTESKPAPKSETKTSMSTVEVPPIQIKGSKSAWSATTSESDRSIEQEAKSLYAEMKAPTPTAGQRLVGVRVSDWDLSEVLSSLSDQTGVSIVLISETNPKVTVRLDGMPLEEVVRILATMTRNSLVAIRNGYVVGSADVLKTSFPREWKEQQPVAELEDDPEFIATYSCQYVDPTELMSAIKGVFGEGFTMSVGPGKVRPKDLDATAGGITGSSSGEASSSSSDSAPTASGKTLVFRGMQSLVERAIKLAKGLDIKQSQVSINVEIVDVSEDAMKDLGVSWQGSTGVNITESNPRGINFGSFGRDAASFAGSIKHLESNGQAKVLARPNISLLDQERGYILIGSRINYPVVVSINDSGQPVFDVKEERVGIYLQVAASINDNGDVTLNLYPQVSTITGFLTVNDASYPQISTREAQTVMKVKSGQTLVMGGLISDEQIKTVERVPILGQIPIFGELFTRRKTTNRASQVMIFITPTIDKGI